MKLSLVISLLPLWVSAQELLLECPREATPGVIEDPDSWADGCFMAVNGRLPDANNIGESSSDSRDIDLDGVPELLEIRGTGNATKQIYVFRQTDGGFEYLGQLDAHPSFVVVLDASGIPTIEYQHRSGADHVELKHIQYIDGGFLEVATAGP